VKQLESIGRELNQLSPAEQEQFRAFARRAAESHPAREVAAGIVVLVEGLLPRDELRR
jgi:hypothetical protein